MQLTVHLSVTVGGSKAVENVVNLASPAISILQAC